MNWNEHSQLEGKHAFLSASNYHWLNYTPSKLVAVYNNKISVEEGIALHAFSSMAINKRIKLAKNKNTVNMFVNDCIGFNMKSEQIVYYSPNSFGTADAISFRDGLLRISDLKTGNIKASFKQLDIYAALFCLEYMVDPMLIGIELRIYQNGECTIASPTGEYIQQIMNRIMEFDGLLEEVKNAV